MKDYLHFDTRGMDLDLTVNDHLSNGILKRSML